VLLRRLLITAAVILVLLFAADRGGVYIAESVAADSLKNSQHLSSRPDVDIAGFPFLTQLASGNFDQITVDAKGVPVGGSAKELNLARLHVVLHGVSVNRSFSRVHADRATATAHVDYDDLGRALGVKLAYAGSGRVRTTASITVLGRTVSGTITARPEVHGVSLGFGGTQVPGGALGADVVRGLQKVFAAEIPFGNMPFQVRIESLQATPGGLELRLSGQDLVYVKS